MTKFLPALLLLVSSAVLGAVPPEDGLYLQAQGKPAPWVTSQEGKKLFLGAKQELKIEKTDLFSQNNTNDKYYLHFTIPYDEGLDSRSYLLIVSGTAYKQSGSDSSQKKTSGLSFNFFGDQNAKQISEYVKSPVIYRRHPQHNLLVSFTPTKQDYCIAEEVTATLQIVNVGTKSVSFRQGGRNRAARDNQYVFSAHHDGKQVDDIGSIYHFGGISVRRVLKPGEFFEDKISLSKWFAFDKAGTYEVHGSYYLNFNDPDDESGRTIWEDYVSADFTVSIKEQEKATNKTVDPTPIH